MVQARLFLAGKVVLKPYGDNQRYDLVIEEEGVFKKVQCKTGRVKDGVILFEANSCSRYCKQQKEETGKTYDIRNYKEDAELFAVYCPELDKTYLVPTALCGGSLRLEPTKNGQAKDIVWAKDYEI